MYKYLSELNPSIYYCLGVHIFENENVEFVERVERTLHAFHAFHEFHVFDLADVFLFHSRFHIPSVWLSQLNIYSLYKRASQAIILITTKEQCGLVYIARQNSTEKLDVINSFQHE